MSASTIEFDPSKLSESVLRLILAKAEELQCSPGEALRLLLDQLAAQSGFPIAA